MKKVTEIMNKELLKEMVVNGYIRSNRHDDLFIYNYTQKTEGERLWNEATKNCRGLILDKEGNIVARPFPKFFNFEEHHIHEIPFEKEFKVEDKLDGVLGILYWKKGEPYIATRGSFSNKFTKTANKLLYDHYYNIVQNELNRDLTYLFEIIAPETRVVVNYGEMSDLILIGVLDPDATEKEVENYSHLFKIPERFDHHVENGIKDLKKLDRNGQNEGFVIKFMDGFKIKMKMDSYKKYHKFLMSMTPKNIWQLLKDGHDVDSMIEEYPSHISKEIKKEKDRLVSEYKKIEKEVKENYDKNAPKNVSEKEYALWAKIQKNPNLYFSYKKDQKEKFSTMIWKAIFKDGKLKSN